MAIKFGIDGKVYYNTGSFASPTWALMPNVRDLTINLSGEKADVTTRGNAGWKAEKRVLKTASIEFEMIWDTEDDGCAALAAAYFANSSMEFLILDGPVGTAGSEGLRATMDVSEFGRSEQLTDAMKVPVTLTPTYVTDPAQAPAWVTTPLS